MADRNIIIEDDKGNRYFPWTKVELVEGAETPAGAQAKADAALNSAKQYTDQKIAELDLGGGGGAPEYIIQGSRYFKPDEAVPWSDPIMDGLFIRLPSNKKLVLREFAIQTLSTWHYLYLEVNGNPWIAMDSTRVHEHPNTLLVPATGTRDVLILVKSAIDDEVYGQADYPLTWFYRLVVE